MANPTTNYGFVLPTATDLVTDLPADFEVALQAVDTQMFTNANAATQKATLTTKGDIYAATGTSTPARLAVGANGTVLKANSSTATGLEWGSAAAAENFTLLNAGGTALTGATTITVSGISGRNRLFILIDGAGFSAGSQTFINVRFNGVSTGSAYKAVGLGYQIGSTYVPGNYEAQDQFARNQFQLGATSTNTASRVYAGLQVEGCNSSGIKILNGVGGGDLGGGNSSTHQIRQGTFTDTNTISSVSILSLAGNNFTAGTVFVYGA